MDYLKSESWNVSLTGNYYIAQPKARRENRGKSCIPSEYFRAGTFVEVSNGLAKQKSVLKQTFIFIFVSLISPYVLYGTVLSRINRLHFSVLLSECVTNLFFRVSRASELSNNFCDSPIPRFNGINIRNLLISKLFEPLTLRPPLVRVFDVRCSMTVKINILFPKFRYSVIVAMVIYSR